MHEIKIGNCIVPRSFFSWLPLTKYKSNLVLHRTRSTSNKNSKRLFPPFITHSVVFEISSPSSVIYPFSHASFSITPNSLSWDESIAVSEFIQRIVRQGEKLNESLCSTDFFLFSFINNMKSSSFLKWWILFYKSSIYGIFLRKNIPLCIYDVRR